MAGQAEKHDVFGDYAVFLKALLPQAQGVVCHDGQGRVFWSEPPPGGLPAQSDAYDTALAARLRGAELPGEAARIVVGPHVAYLVRLEGEGGRLLGALTLYVERSGAPLPFAFVAGVVQPAIRSLQREMSLRFRVLDSQRRLQVQAAEEKLLHSLEELLGDAGSCEDGLRQVARLCREHLRVADAWVHVPDKSMSVAARDDTAPADVAAACAGLLEEAAGSTADPAAVRSHGDGVWFALYGRGSEPQGVLLLRGVASSDFSERRLRRVVRFVGSHVESLLEQHFDGLTGLPAWPVFERTLARATAGADRRRYLVMMVDVDQLHVLNDTFGRQAGDDVLRRLGRLLREKFPGAELARAAGDTFAALLRGVSMDDARRLGDDLCTAVRENAYVQGDRTYRPSVSIGIGPLEEGDEPRSGLGAAQVACDAARDRGGGRVEVYQSADASIIRRRDDIQLVGYVRNAIENDRLALVAQQLAPLKAGRVTNYYEVLVRLVGESGEHVAPGTFMSAAERYNLMEELDRWVLSTTLEKLAKRGRHLRGGDARFAVNLSGQSLGSAAFLGFVADAVRRSGVPPDLITFEITESVAVARMQQAQAFMQELRRIGCHFSLDDFGTGLSSFAYLKLFPVDTLKIDGSFVRDIATNVVSQSVVAAIAEVARVMQLETVAEYVQDQAAVDLLRGLGISYAQGFFVGSTALLDEQIDGIDHAVATGATRSLGTAV